MTLSSWQLATGYSYPPGGPLADLIGAICHHWLLEGGAALRALLWHKRLFHVQIGSYRYVRLLVDQPVYIVI
jgi:hypothetical protein